MTVQQHSSHLVKSGILPCDTDSSIYCHVKRAGTLTMSYFVVTPIGTYHSQVFSYVTPAGKCFVVIPIGSLSQLGILSRDTSWYPPTVRYLVTCRRRSANPRHVFCHVTLASSLPKSSAARGLSSAS